MKPAFVIPYRDRKAHLDQFLPALESYMKVPYEVFVIEQDNNLPFNRAMLINIGFQIMSPYCDYMISHDVDMLPVTADYSPSAAAHLATQCSQFGYKMPYPAYFGGVNVFSKEVFQDINGFSNKFWGWGAEDDDLLQRVHNRGHKIESRGCRFESLSHDRNINPILHRANVSRLRMHGSKFQQFSDGLSSLKYDITGADKIGYNASIYKVNFSR